MGAAHAAVALPNPGREARRDEGAREERLLATMGDFAQSFHVPEYLTVHRMARQTHETQSMWSPRRVT